MPISPITPVGRTRRGSPGAGTTTPQPGSGGPRRSRRCGDDGGPARPGEPRLEYGEVGAGAGVVVEPVVGPDLEQSCRAAQESGSRLVPDGRSAQAAAGPGRAVGGVDHDVRG